MEETIIAKIKENDLSFITSITLDYKFSDDTQLIHKACFYNNTDLLLYLINKGVDINLKGGKYYNTPLCFTIYNNSIEAAYILFEVGVDITYKNKIGLTFPMLCIKFDNILCFILFFVYGENILINKKKKYIYLYSIIKNKYRFIEVVKRLRNENVIACSKKENILYKNVSKIQLVEEILCAKFYKVPIFLIGIFVFLYYKLPNMCLLLIIALIVSHRRDLVKSNFYIFLILFYTFMYFYNLILINNYLLIIIIPYSFIFFRLLFYKPKKVYNNFSDGKKIIHTLLRRDKCNIHVFCYICWIEKDKNTIHCHYCQTCVFGFDHHCKFLGTCINEDNKRIFDIYLILKIALFLFIKDISISKAHRTHYKIFLLFSIIQILQRLPTCNTKKKSKTS